MYAPGTPRDRRVPAGAAARRAAVALVAAFALIGCAIYRTPAGVGPPFLRVAGLARVSDLPALSPPAWAPDGRRLAFSTEDAVWAVRLDRPGKRRLAALPRVTAVAWAPDGRMLGALAGGTVYAVATVGAPPRPLIGDGGAELFAWAPRGDRIACVVAGGQRQEVLLATPSRGRRWSGAIPRVLWSADATAEIRALVWRRDGLALAVALGPRESGRATRLATIPVAATREGPRTLPLRGPARDVAVAPDGRMLAYVAVSAGAQSDEQHVIAIRSDGAGRRVVASGYALSGLAWAPSGGLLAFADATGDGDVYVVIADVETGARLRVADYRPEIPPKDGVLAIAWAPDGLALAFGTDTGEGVGPVWVARLERR
jgi:dipeptidyl aminopeptidase/acylaminoacyl peptidase